MNDLVKVKIDERVYDLLPESREFIDKLAETVELQIKLALYKNKIYKNSWRKCGEAGTWINFQRKADRIFVACDEHFNHEVPFPDGEESLTEGLADAANYAMFWIGFVSELRPDEFQLWRRRIEFEFVKKISNHIRGDFQVETEVDGGDRRG